MSKRMTRLMAAALIAVAVPSFASIAAAAPVNGAFALKNSAPSNVEAVRWYGYGGWRGGWGWGRGWGIGAGIAAGAVVGGLLAAPYYYGGYYPYYGAGYYGAAPYYGGYYTEPGYVDDGYPPGGGGYPPAGGGYPAAGGGYYGGGAGGGDGVQYCMQRYRTYNPRTGTFIGNDGRPHPCP